MQYFSHNNQEWLVEEVPLRVIAENFGTPCYVYSEQAIRDAWLNFEQGFAGLPHTINYAVKANSNLAILKILHDLGSHFDIVSYGELVRLLQIHCDPKKIIFSGVGKTSIELQHALTVGVGCINVESAAELYRLNELAINSKTIVNIALRINPEVDLKAHPYIATGVKGSKFGISITQAEELCLIVNKLSGINLIGLAFHLGSQIISLDPFKIAINKVLTLMTELTTKYPNQFNLTHINIGGGLGVDYSQATQANKEYSNIIAYMQMLVQEFKNSNLIIHIEPGRSIVANAGILLSKIEYIKPATKTSQCFAIIDAAMNDLIRPALYGAWHAVIPVNITSQTHNNQYYYDLVGPICENSDFLAKSRLLTLNAGELIFIANTGAYGFSMSSNYNSRPRVAEIMVKGKEARLIREREQVTDLFKGEKF